MSNIDVPIAARQAENAAAHAQREAGNPHDTKPETPCPVVREFEAAEVEARHCASVDYSGELATAYGQAAWVLARIVRRHVRECTVCQRHELALRAAAGAR
jgi:hypothetical protein